MERLTKRSRGLALHHECFDVCGTCTGAPCPYIQPMVDRLAAYEDTGLEPEEIKELCTDDVAEVSRMFRHMIEDGSIDHIQELLKAEKDGRMKVLPCKVGDTVWAITSPTNIAGMASNNEELEIFECTVESITFYTSCTSHKSSPIQFRLYYYVEFVAWYVTDADFGKTVFLTREEAEAALKGETNETDPV